MSEQKTFYVAKDGENGYTINKGTLPNKGKVHLVSMVDEWIRQHSSGSIIVHFSNGRIAKIEERSITPIK